MLRMPPIYFGSDDSEVRGSAMSGLEKATHVCLICMCCVSLSVLAEKRFKAKTVPIKAETPLSGRSLVGRWILFKGVTWSPKNAVIITRSTCKYCVASTPFYRRLSEARRKPGAGFSVVFVSPDAPEVTRDFLRNGGITADQVFQSRLEQIGVAGTPTILVVDAKGVITRQFDGQLPEVDEQEVFAALAGVATGAPAPVQRNGE
jgi:hypothetical protein